MAQNAFLGNKLYFSKKLFSFPILAFFTFLKNFYVKSHKTGYNVINWLRVVQGGAVSAYMDESVVSLLLLKISKLYN